MSAIRLLACVLLIFPVLVGCVPVPVIGLTPVFVGGPTGFDLPDYSLGPVSSDQFPDLIETAIPASEGEALLFGRVDMVFRADHRMFDITAVAALSESKILLLKWYEPEDRYKIVARLSYSEILSVETITWGLGRSIYLCLATTDFELAGQSRAIEQLVSMTFIKSAGFVQDRHTSGAAFALLQERIKPIDGACEKRIESTDENSTANSQGFLASRRET